MNRVFAIGDTHFGHKRIIEFEAVNRHSLQASMKALGVGSKYGASTTHMSKLLPRILGGGGGGCPLLVFGIQPTLYIDDTNP